MKYIRTKDELGIETKDGTCYFRTWVAHSNSPLKKDWLYADTIEELCDEFVVVNDSDFFNGRDIYYRAGLEACHRGDSYYDFTFEQVRTGRRNIGGTIYGAIWTEKGLIYVAKMNDKGELELL